MKDNPRILQRYRTPNIDGQIAIQCVHFNNSFKKDLSQTCSINQTFDDLVGTLQTCEVLNGQFCDCFQRGYGYEV